MKKDELAQQKQEKLDKLNELITSTNESAKSIAKDMSNKLELLKVCYERSSSKQKNKVHELTNYSQLICYLTGKPFSNSYETKPIELKHLVYTERSINKHIENGLPKNNNEQAIEIYSFYFGGYRAFFRCFTKEFLELRIKQKKEFLDDIFSQKNIDSEETALNQYIEPCQKLNIIPSIEIKESILRIDILENLFNRFQNNKKVAISGISGIGKTFLAKHFTEHYQGKFSNMVWLNCANGFPKAFSQEKGIGLLGSLGLAQEYSSYIGNEKGLMNLVIGHLAKFEGNNLLILDNLDESISSHKDEITFLSKNWNILGTSQQQLKGFENYSAPDFKKESLDLFYTFYTVEKDDDNLIRLLSAIEYHTLAIELLAKTAQERGLSIIALLNRFTKKGINVVEQVEIDADHGDERDINIENIEEYLGIIFDTSSLKEEQCKIMLNIALLQEDSIPMELFEEVYLNKTNEEDIIDAFNYNFKALVRKGWVQMENERIRIHGLVKSIILKKFLYKEEYFDSTIQYLENILAERHTLHDLNKIQYLKLSESILENITYQTGKTINLRKGVSLFHAEIGLYEKSKEFELSHLNKLLEAPKDENLVEIINELHNLSVISKAQGKYDEAVLYSEQLFLLFSDQTRQVMQFKLIDALTLFFEENKIENAESFESKFDKIVTIQLLEMFLSSFLNISMYKNEKEDIHDKIEKLLSIISIRTEIMSLFENNIPESVILTIKIYKKLLLGNDTVFHQIGRYYIKLKEYNKAEEFIKRSLKIEEKIFESGHQFFSSTYSSLTLLYIKREDLEGAKYYLEKNREICNKLAQNSPYITTFKESLHAFEELQHKQSVSRNLEKKLSKFDIQNNKNQNAKYYNELSSVYLEYEDYEKANEYLIKEINILLNTEEIEFYSLFHLYLKSGRCYLKLNDLDNASQLYNKAVRLRNENNINDIEINREVNDFKELLIKYAFKKCFIPIISPIIKKKLEKLESKYMKIVSDLPSNTILSIIVNEIFKLLFTLPDLEDAISDENDPPNDMLLFIDVYDFLIRKTLDKSIESKSASPQLNNLQYKILDEYYQTIIDLLLKYDNWNISIQYYFKRLFLNKEYFEVSKNTGSIYFDVSVCYFNLRWFEPAIETIHKSILIYNMVYEESREIKEIEQIKSFLKDALYLEKRIKEEIEKFKH